MQAPTHATFGLVFVIAAGTVLGLVLTPAVAAFAVLGALLPDVDTPTSLIGKLVLPLARLLERRFGHRTVTHSLLGLALFASPVAPLALVNPQWPLAFGLGAPMVAMVGSNIGAGQNERARRIALVGGAMAFALAEAVGLIAAAFPYAWLRLFGSDAHLLAAGAAYLRIVGPFYGFFALGFSLYFASQGAGKLKWPLTAGAARLALYVGLGGAVLAVSHSLTAFYVLGAIAMTTYGAVVVWSVAAGTWFRKPHRAIA